MKRLLLVFGIWLAVAASASACAGQEPSRTSNVQTKAPSPASDEIVAGSSASFPYPSLVWNDHVYRITKDSVTQVDRLLGEIESFLGNETDTPEGNHSNFYPKGTKLYSIMDTDPTIAIAVQTGEGAYVKAVHVLDK